jgi:hypothetical protein
MIKVVWLLKRAPHLSLAEFRSWWLDSHIHMITELQKPYLKKYIVNVRREEDTLPGKPSDEPEWDGCAEQWFATEADFIAVYGRATPSPSRADTLKHVSRFQRMIVEEHEIPVKLS